MNQNSYLALLHLLPGMTHKRLQLLSEKYHRDWEKVWSILDKNLLRDLGIKEEQIEKIFSKKFSLSFSTMEKHLKEREIFMIEQGDTFYPKILTEVSPVPYVLYVRGNKKLLENSNNFAIVGTRKMTVYGSQIVDAFLPDLLAVDLTIVSGLAFGVDSYVHKKVLEHDGKTIAVIGSGVDIVYPVTNKKLVEELLVKGGLLLSEFPLGKMPEPFHFPLRNRIIAALSKGVLVVEAGEKSGACITADIAVDLGKEVFAVPGNIFAPYAAGTNELLKKGTAHPVTDAKGMLEILGFSIPENTGKPSTTEDPFLSLFTFLPEEQEVLISKFGGLVQDFQMQLTMAELAGKVRKVEGTKWVRVLI